MKPKKSILNPEFKYTNAANTDLRKTFARVRREMRESKNVVKFNNCVFKLSEPRKP